MFDVTGPRRYSAAFAVSLVLLCGPSAAQVPPNPSSVTRPGVGSAPAAASAQPHNEQVVLAPHRAVYEISLDQSRNAGSVTDMSGRMVYELTGSACEGWSQSMRFVSRMTGQDGTTGITDMRSTSWEDAAARTLRFSSSQYKDSKLGEQTNGEGSRESFNAPLKVEIARPAKKEIKIKSDAYFPVQHSIAVLAAARRGETVFQADLYDGSEKGEKLYDTTTFIGKRRPAGYNTSLPNVVSAARLNEMTSWPVSISYFEAGSDKKDAVPSYELAFVYFENGVSRRLFIDYGDFAIRGTLKDIVFLEATKCEPKKP